MAQPTDDLIIWASSDVDLPNLAGPNKKRPMDDLILKGWDFKEKPTADEFNYVLNNMGQYISYLLNKVNKDTTYTFSGDVTGSVNSSGSDVNFIIAVNDNSHYHTSDTILDATSSATPNTIVKRDSSGNASATNWVGNLTGNADTASTLLTGNAGTSGFTTSKATNGYTYLPNGILLQWGYASSVLEDGVFTITLPITFPNAAFSLSVTPVSDQLGLGSTDFSAHGKILSRSQIALAITSVSGAFPGAAGVYWLIIGH